MVDRKTTAKKKQASKKAPKEVPKETVEVSKETYDAIQRLAEHGVDVDKWIGKKVQAEADEKDDGGSEMTYCKYVLHEEKELIRWARKQKWLSIKGTLIDGLRYAKWVRETMYDENGHPRYDAGSLEQAARVLQLNMAGGVQNMADSPAPNVLGQITEGIEANRAPRQKHRSLKKGADEE